MYDTSDEMLKKADELALQVIEHARNTLFLNLRFMDNALSRLRPTLYEGTIGTDTTRMFYDPFHVLREFKENEYAVAHLYLHTIMHCIFRHPYVSPAIRRELWDLSCDCAVEQMIRELDVPSVINSTTNAAETLLDSLREQVQFMTAEHIYHFFSEKGVTDEQAAAMRRCFLEDDHEAWYEVVRQEGNGDGGGGGSPDTDDSSRFPFFCDPSAMSFQEASDVWKKLSQQIEIDLESFSVTKGNMAGCMIQNLKELHREKYDYSEFLRKFSVMGEAMHIDEDSFDYNFYTYGLNLYGNVPLVEPLEYKEVRRIREFVIAIDTSGSVMGETVQKFIQKTYNILMQQENFFNKVNIHIIQCDAQIQSDVKITSRQEFDEFIKSMKLYGFGGTDFQPVFQYVDQLIKQKEFKNLRGLIYFTDGFGTFPNFKPSYKTAFVFLDNAQNNYDVPIWALKLILRKEEIDGFDV